MNPETMTDLEISQEIERLMSALRERHQMKSLAYESGPHTFPWWGRTQRSGYHYTEKLSGLVWQICRDLEREEFFDMQAKREKDHHEAARLALIAEGW